MENTGTLIGLLGLLGTLIGLICLAYPLQALRIDTRAKGALVTAAGVVVFVFGAVLSSDGSDRSGQASRSETALAAAEVPIAPLLPEPSDVPPQEISKEDLTAAAHRVAGCAYFLMTIATRTQEPSDVDAYRHWMAGATAAVVSVYGKEGIQQRMSSIAEEHNHDVQKWQLTGGTTRLRAAFDDRCEADRALVDILVNKAYQ